MSNSEDESQHNIDDLKVIKQGIDIIHDHAWWPSFKESLLVRDAEMMDRIHSEGIDFIIKENIAATVIEDFLKRILEAAKVRYMAERLNLMHPKKLS